MGAMPATQSSVGQAGFAVLDKDFLAAQAGLAIALQAGPQRISDQDEAIAAFHLIGQFLRCRMDVEVVADQFSDRRAY